MSLILAKIFWNFDLELQAESKKWFLHDMFVVWNKPPLHVKLVPVVKG
jgi:hypothetical protein